MQRKFCGFNQARALAFVVIALSGFLIPSSASAESSSATQPSTLQLRIGSAAVDLAGQWRFHPGDSPLRAGGQPEDRAGMLWAQPDFDDSQWPTQDLTPPPGSYDPINGASGFIPGWTAQGYPNLTRYAWYRLRVNVENIAPSGGEPPTLSILMPESVDDAYQVFANGQYLGEFGHFSRDGVMFINSQPRAFSLPANLRSGPITIAVRMWMDDGTPLVSQDAGGLHQVPLLGQSPAIDAMLRISWYEVNASEAMNIIRLPIVLLAILLGITLFWLDRREPAYLWLALACSAYFASIAITLTGYYTTWLSMALENFLADVVLTPLIFGLWVIFWGSWFRLAETRRIQRAAWSLVALLILFLAPLRAPLYGHIVPASASTWLVPVTILLKLALGVLIYWVIYRGVRTRGIEGWLPLPAVLLLPLVLYGDEMLTLHLQEVFHVFGIVITVQQISMLVMLAAISLLMMRRFVGGMREREQLKLEVEQARQVQRLLVPESGESIPGFTVDSQYLPAQQVGGDFFLLIPAADGSLLAVLGDVAGKGLQAAMTVAMIVGAVRALAESTREPADLLRALNRRLCARVSDSAIPTTCIAIRIDRDGEATLANAGHLPPYKNGIPLPTVGAVPLGITLLAEPETLRFRMEPGDRLLLITDGVSEARNAQGDLYGFERANQLIASGIAPSAITQAAAAFGQQDDMTVVAVVRS
jgi:hypothetical protein